jgi:hypothetical protein
MDPELASAIIAAANDARARAWDALVQAQAKKQDIQLPKSMHRKWDRGWAAPGKNYEPHNLEAHLTGGEGRGSNSKSNRDCSDIEQQPPDPSPFSLYPSFAIYGFRTVRS